MRRMADVLMDMHIHSTASDGTDSPETILEKARAAGIRYLALTDHDTDSGCNTIKDAGSICFIRGIEFSCREEKRKYHILGYGFEPDSEVQKLIEFCHHWRMIKCKNRFEFLTREYGFEFTEEEKQAVLANENPGKPHIGNLMAKKGYAASKSEAIERYINNYHGEEAYISPERAIRAILDSGGIPVLAHAVFGDGSQHLSDDEVEWRIARLKEYGLAGIECFYSQFDRGQEKMLLQLTGRYDLAASAGSDYHGTNKEIRIGEHGLRKEMMDLPAVQRFLTMITGA